MNQMGKGVKNWFSCNAKWLVPTLIGVLAALVALEILTGGAVTAALPPLMQVIGAIMIGVAIVRVAGYVADYLAKALSKDVAGAAKSLARVGRRRDRAGLRPDVQPGRPPQGPQG